MSYQAPITTQVPNEEMFYQGRLTPAWTMFFQRLARLADLGNLANLIELLQLTSQLPVKAQEAEQGERINVLEQLIPSIPIIPQPEPQIMPLSQVAFFCAEETLPFRTAQLPDAELMPFVSMQIYAHNEPLPLNSLDDQLLQVINP